MVILIAAGTISATLANVGPFQRGDFYDNFTLVHSHLFTVSLAGMLLAASFADLRRTIGLEIEARRTAEEAAASRVRLLQMISHDVRTPLSGILTVLQTLARCPASPERVRLIGLGLRAGRTLTTLVTGILEAARADAGRITLVLAPFSPAASLADIVDLCRPAAADKRLLIHLSRSSRVPALVSGDRVRFEQIVSNLLVNAVAYTPRGSVCIDADWDESGGGSLVVVVADTGPGIDPARVPRMFDAFAFNDQQAGSSAGLGLGLHICRRLTELMAGSIHYAAEPAGGSRFRVTLPFLVTVVAPAASPSQADPPLRILLVEDDEIAGETTSALLRSHGHETVFVANAAAALAHAASDAFDLVLLDLQLGRGGDTGFDVVRSIRTLPGANAMVHVLALTGDDIAGSQTALEAAGFDGVVAKPMIIESGIAAMIKAAMWEDHVRQAGGNRV
jgi:signal transduction histidine kinase/ActR/RegA family two-component response regulator